MKPDSLKGLLNFYLKEKIKATQYDDVDGIYDHCGAEPVSLSDDRLSECAFLFPQQAVPAVPQLRDVDLSPEGFEVARSVARQLSQMSDEFEMGRSRSASINSDPDNEGNKAVQFKKRCIFVSPNEEKVQINVERTGDADEVVQVKWKTDDKTARSGVHYHGSEGEITFSEGETAKTVEVGIVKNHRDKNICFDVNLLNPEGIDIGANNPMTVYIADHSNLVQSERQVIDNIMNNNGSASEIAICLHDDLTVNTFRTALQYQCSYYDSVPHKLAFACELVKLSVGKAPLETLGEIVCQFFSHLPELEDIFHF